MRRGKNARRRGWVGIQVLMNQDRPTFVGDADVHHACVKIDPTVVLVTVRGEAHSLPPPRNGWPMGDSGLSHCDSTRGRRKYLQYAADGAVRRR